MVETRKIECPFCKNQEIIISHTPPTLQCKVNRVGSNKSTVYYYTKEKYEVQSDCPKCGKSAKEIQKALDKGKKAFQKASLQKEGKIAIVW